jgi:hypothetical protein
LMHRLIRLRLHEFAARQAGWHLEMEQLAAKEVWWADRKRMWWSAKYAAWWQIRARWHRRRRGLWATLVRLTTLP